MKNKKIILMGVVLVFVLVIGVSFAIWQITLQQESTNVITRFFRKFPEMSY